MLSKLTQSYDIKNLVEELNKIKLDVNKLDKIMASGKVKINSYIDEKKKITLLHKYIKGNNFQATQWLIKNQANPYTEDYYNLPAFFYFMHSPVAAKIFTLLEENNIDFSYKNSHGRMLLQDLVINGEIALFNKVLKKVKNPFALDDYGKNILFDAISSGDKDTMNLVFDIKDAPLAMQDTNKESLLHFVKDGDLNLIEFLLEKHVPPTLQDKQSKNIIFYLSERVEKASSEQDIKHLTKLIDIALKEKESHGQKDNDGNNLLTGFLGTLNKPLSQYSQKNFLSDLISKFVDSGVDIDEKNKEGNNALLLSVAKNDLDAVILLIKKNADINVVNAEDITPLALAVMKGSNEYLEMVKLLLGSGANPNIKDSKDSTIFEKIVYILIYINHENMKKENNADMSLTPAVQHEDDVDLSRFNEDDFIRNAFELMVSSKLVDYEILNSHGNPYFYILVFTENTYLVNLMFKHGADINQSNKDGQNILQYYLNFIDENPADDGTINRIMKNIVKFGIDLNHRDNLGATIVHNTLLKNPLKITKNIVSSGGSVDAIDNKGRTLLHNAIWANDIEKVQYILGVKSELVNEPDKLGVLPINYAAFLGNKDLVCYLLHHNAFINNLHEKHKSTLDFFKRFHKNIFKLEKEHYDDSEERRHIKNLITNMKEEFNIVD